MPKQKNLTNTPCPCFGARAKSVIPIIVEHYILDSVHARRRTCEGGITDPDTEERMIKGVTQRDKAAEWYRRFHVSDFAVLLHLPFASIVLDFAVVGAMLAQHIYVDRLLLAAIGVFFAHQGSHFLDETRGRHWGTKIPDRLLYAFSLVFLTVGAVVGVYLALTVSLLLAAFIIPMVFFPIAYSLELWNDRFHGPVWFGVSCALVCLGSFFLQTLTISLFSLFMSIAVGIQGTYIIILYEATKKTETRALAWNTLKGIILLWNLIALAMITLKFV
jgi:hypothetical protein